MNIYLSFDDGRKDNFDTAYPIIKKYNLKAVFHLTTGFIDGTYKSNDFGIGRKPLSIDDIKILHENNMEISLHGDKHTTSLEDFLISYKKIKDWIPIKNRIGFSVPNSKFKYQNIMEIKQNKNVVVDYVRVGRSEKCYSFLNKIIYFIYLKTKSQLFFNLFNKHNIVNNGNSFLLNSLVVTKDTKCSNLTNFIKKYRNSGKHLIIMFHSIVEKPSNKWEWSTNNFDSFCKFLKNEGICTKLLKEIKN